MGAKSSIEWTDSSWSAIRARVKQDAPEIAKAKGYTSLVQIAEKMRGHVGPHCEHVSPGCERCYSEINNCRLLTAQDRSWLELWYPLIFEVPLRRHHIPHSACYMCPNLADAEWIDMKMNWPKDFYAACVLESEVRERDPHFFLHPSCVPLSKVDFYSQTSMFSERGCTTGCFT